MAQQSLAGQALLIIEDSRSHSDIPHSVELPWTSDRPVADTSDNTQHLQQTDIDNPGGIRTRNPSKQEAADYSRI
jgi:hypothetical protein